MNFQVFLFLFIVSTAFADAQKKVVCYWLGKISTGQIDPSICTHIVYSSLGFDSQGGLTHISRMESEALGYIRGLVALKQQRPGLKVLAAVGGGIDNSPWADVARNDQLRKNFASNVLAFVQNNNLDGVDVNWDYPTDKANFVSLLKTLKRTLGSRYSVSVALVAGQGAIELSYDLPQIAANVDFINLMTYDLHGSWESKTGIHGCLYRSPLDNTPMNVDESVKLLLNAGIERSKLIVGIPTHGNAFQLNNPKVNGVGAEASGTDSSDYREICQKVRSGALTYRWDDTQKVPYAFNGNYWVGFDDKDSVTGKAKYIKNNNLGGAMFWTIDNDDYDNVCGDKKFPLITAAYKILIGAPTPPPVLPLPNSYPATSSPVHNPPVYNPPPTNTPAPPPRYEPPPPPYQPPQPAPTSSNSNCPSNGLHKDPTNCSKFFNCWEGFPHSMSCNVNERFNDVTKVCDWAARVKC